MRILHVRNRRLAASLTATALVIVLAGCSVGATPASEGAADEPASTNAVAGSASSASALWDSSAVHAIAVEYDDADYDALIEAYVSAGEKEWITATVTIDGETFENVGLKLKGNSTLRSLSTSEDASLSADDPQNLPWILRLDKYVDGQNLDGTTELVVRGNSSETSLNEALALDLLDAAGLAAEQAISVRFSANGSEESLRLVVENPSDEWADRELGEVLLYKAEAGGDYSYRGEDAASYDDVFDQEAGDDDLTPLISFLQWINESDDATFAADLDEHLDVEAFATYLAFQDLVDNFDDIDGPGNNSYLSFDPETGLMTVVNWDLNLAFGASPGEGAGGGGDREGGGRMGRQDADTGDAQTAAARGGGGRGGSNILSERFLAVDEFQALYTAAQDRLQSELVDSGLAADILASWSDTLSEQASDLVSTSVIAEETEALADALGQ